MNKRLKIKTNLLLFKMLHKKIFLLIMVSLSIGCVSQTGTEQTLAGSWAPIVDKMAMEEYIEMFFTESKAFYYEGGLGLTSVDYQINNGVFSTRVDNSDSFDEKSKVRIMNDTLIFSLNNIDFKYYKVKQKGVGDFISGEIDEESFLEAYEYRLKMW